MDDSNSHDPRFGRTAPTWEVELLISGVAVFAMLQLPGWLDDAMFALSPRLNDDWQMVVKLSYFYAKSAAVVLAVTFALHLLLRAQWIALVGMHSVYPQGIRLERMRMGPIQRAVEAETPDSTEEAIERADNRASVVFAIGVSVALMIVFVCVSFCGGLLLVTLLTQVFQWRADPVGVMFVAFAALMLPFMAVATFDHTYAHRLDPGGRAHRMVASVLRFYTRIGMGRRNNHIIALLTSNEGERRMMALVVGSMVLAILVVAASYVAMREPSAFGNYGQFPDGDARVVNPAHYDDRRNAVRTDALPYLQSAVIEGPYLALVVPYRPDRLEAAMRKQCGHAASLEDDALAVARLACLQALHPVVLDGKPVADLAYEATRDARTGRPALLAMIDVRALPAGRHELRIARPPRADKPGKDRPDPGFDAIPFWR